MQQALIDVRKIAALAPAGRRDCTTSFIHRFERTGILTTSVALLSELRKYSAALLDNRNPIIYVPVMFEPTRAGGYNVHS